MKIAWALGLYDNDGDKYEDCLLLFCEEKIILKFENSTELEKFADNIKSCLKEIRENENI